jgi:hypothetical protein
LGGSSGSAGSGGMGSQEMTGRCVDR